MKDFPLFTTEYGVASLVLREIPYKKAAYVTIQATLEPEKLIGECVSFCRMCGAERIYAKGHSALMSYPIYTTVFRMSRSKDKLPETDAYLRPVTATDLEQWRSVYNSKSKTVPNSAWMTQLDAQEMLESGTGYFVFRGDACIGIGKVSGDSVDWVASLIPGAGRDVLVALCKQVSADEVRLTVANNNFKAVRLYEGLGFEVTEVLTTWYKIFESVQ